MFDFIILVCVFYQVNYQMVMVVGGEINQVINYQWVVFLISLNNKIDIVLVCQFRFEIEFFQQIEGDFQMIGFFGVNVDINIVLMCQQGE